MSVAVCCFNVLLRNIGGILHSPLRYSHEALRFLAILGKSFFPKLQICALHTRQLSALTKCLEQLGLFMQPRSDEFGPFLTESLQGCAQFRVLLHRFCLRVSAHFDEPCEIKKRHGIRKLTGIVVTRWLVCHFFRPLFCMRKEEDVRRRQNPCWECYAERSSSAFKRSAMSSAVFLARASAIVLPSFLTTFLVSRE